MNEQQPTVAGRLATDTDALRAFGRQLAEHGGALEGLEIDGVVGGAIMPGSTVERALAVAAEACGTALSRVHQDYAFAGDESTTDSSRFEEHEQEHAAGFRSVGDQIKGA